MDARKIVVGYDHSEPARAALTWAYEVAAGNGAPVEIVYTHELPGWIPSEFEREEPDLLPGGEWEHTVVAELQAWVDAHPAVAGEVVAVHGHPAQTLIDRSYDAGLVVIGSAGHSAVAGLLGSVSVAVSSHAHCPVAVVRGRAAVSAPVVAGVDGSAAAWPVLRFAAGQAAARRVALRVLHAWRSPAGHRADSAGERHHLDELVARCRAEFPGLAVQPDSVVGHPAAALAAASAFAGLLVVGSRGRGPVRSLLLGSVSQHVLSHSSCTVAVVHAA